MPSARVAPADLSSLLAERDRAAEKFTTAVKARDEAASSRDRTSAEHKRRVAYLEGLARAHLDAQESASASARALVASEAAVARERDEVERWAAAVSTAKAAAAPLPGDVESGGAGSPAASTTAGEEPPRAPASVPRPLGLLYLRVPEVTLCCLRKDNCLRRCALVLVRSTAFDAFVLLNILFNFVLLAAYAPLSPGDGADALSTSLEPWFQAFFTFECLLKLAAIGARAYFSDAWCVADFIVVIMTYLVYIPGTGNASGLRALRALRPLRTFGLVPSLRFTFNGILATFAHMAHVEVYEVFVLFVMALTGVQLWAGAMSGGCFFPAEGLLAPALNSSSSQLGAGSLMFPNSGGVDPTSAWRVMPGWVRNRAIDNLFYNADEAFGYCPLPPHAYTDAGLAPTFAAAGAALSCPPVYGTFLNGTTGLMAQSCLPFRNPLSYGAPQEGFSFDNIGIAFLTSFVAETEEGWSVAFVALWQTWGAPALAFIWFAFHIVFIDEYLGIMVEASCWSVFSDVRESVVEMDRASATPAALMETVALERVALREMWGERLLSGEEHARGEESARRGAACRAGCLASIGSCYVDRVPGIPACIAERVRALETSPLFNGFTQAVVVANILSLACAHTGASEAYTNALDVANWAFVAIFVAELAIRLLSRGARAFCSEAANVFDAIIVIASVVDVFTSLYIAHSAGGISALRVLRVFRVFRAFKLVRSWRTLNKLLSTLGRSIYPSLSFLFIAFIIILIFAAIGTQIFGGRYAAAIAAGHLDEYPRANFDSFPWAIITVFNIVDGENWFIPMYQHIALIGGAAAVFFVAVTIIGGVVMSLMTTNFMLVVDEEEEAAEVAAMKAQLNGVAGEGAAAIDASPLSLSGRPRRGASIAEARTTFEYASISSGPDGEMVQRTVSLTIDIPPRDGNALPRSLLDTDAHSLSLGGRGVALRIVIDRAGSRVIGVDAHSGKILDDYRLGNPAAAFDADMLQQLVELPPFDAEANDVAAGALARAQSSKCGSNTDAPPLPSPSVVASASERSPFSLPHPETVVVGATASPGGSSSQSPLPSSFPPVSQALPGGDDATSKPIETPSPAAGAHGQTPPPPLPPPPPIPQRQQPSRCCLRARITVAHAIYNDVFDAFSFIVTLWACVNLALDEPWLPLCDAPALAPPACAGGYGASLKAYLNSADAAFTAFFALEVVLKAFSQGLWGPPGSFAYLRSRWNVVDCVIAVSSAAALAVGQQAATGAALRAVRAIRAARALRGLRFLRWSGLSSVTGTLLHMLPSLANSVVIAFLFLYIFAIIGLQSFAGQQSICNDFTVTDGPSCVGNFTIAGRNCAMLPTAALEAACRAMGSNSNFTMPRIFEPSNPNWDSFGQALLQAYSILDGENWPSLMYNTVDGGNKEGEQGGRDINQGRGWFFVIAKLFMDAVVIDIVVATVRTAYRNLRSSADGRRFLTRGERKLLQNSLLVLESAPRANAQRPPSSGACCGVRAAAHTAIHTGVFEGATLALVAACAVVLAIHNASMSALLAQRLEALCYLFTAFYALEVALRLLADGLDARVRVGWNLFDTACTVAALIGAGLSGAYYAGAPSVPADTAVMRVALALRTFRLASAVPLLRGVVPFFDSLQPTVRTLRRVLPRFLQLQLFFAVVIYIYAIVGMAAFGNVRWGYAGDNVGGNLARSTGNINAHTNFDSFFVAAWSMFRFYTGENWNFAMTDLQVSAPYCLSSDRADNTCGPAAFAIIFFVSFMAFNLFVFDSLLGSFVLEAFWLDHPSKHAFVGWEDPADRMLYNLTHHSIVAFQDAWAAYDPWGDAPGVTRRQLEAIVALVDAPLGSHHTSAALASDTSLKESSARAAALVAKLDLGRTAGGLGEQEGTGGEDCTLIPYHVALHALVVQASSNYGSAVFGRVDAATSASSSTPPPPPPSVAVHEGSANATAGSFVVSAS